VSATVIDLFCGPGGLGTGFSRYFEVVEAVDIDRDACRTYQTNHAETAVRNRDVRDISLTRGDCDILLGIIGGPPCQSFSQLNYKGVGEQRGKLMWEMVRVTREARPEFVLLENVATVPRELKAGIIKAFRELGYGVEAKVIRAWDYGSVQLRRRWILTASRAGAPVYPAPRPFRRVAAEILTGEPAEITPTRKTIEMLRALPAGKWVALPGQKFKAYYIVVPTRPLPSVANPTKLRYVRPDRSGYLSLAELARAQGFPQGYAFHGTVTSVGQQLANAVPVELAEAFAEAFFNRIGKKGGRP